MKKKLSSVLILLLWVAILTWCNWKNVWDVDYDLSTEMWRQLHCYAQFQKNVKAESYGAEWTKEVNDVSGTIVEWQVKADGEKYNLVCNFSDDLEDWSINYTPVNAPEIWNPASEYCLNQWWSYEIVSNEKDIYGECAFSDWSVCEQWALYKGECNPWDSLNEEIQVPQFDLQTEEGRIAACEERAGFYLNFNEWTFTWENEEEDWWLFDRNGHVAYLKRWEKAEDDLECIINIQDGSVNINLSNHIYSWESQEIDIVEE